METTVSRLRVTHSYTPSSYDRKLNWPFLAFWLSYFALGVTIGCSLLSYCVL
jgi:hypothetical protein